jgi:hypothetical protein
MNIERTQFRSELIPLLLSSFKETSILSPTALSNSLYTEVAVLFVGKFYILL